MGTFSRPWAAQVVLFGLAVILQSCVTSCPDVSASAVGGRVASHMAGGALLAVQGRNGLPVLRGGGNMKVHRSRSGLETEGEAVAMPKRTPSVLREGSSPCMPNGAGHEKFNQTDSELDTTDTTSNILPYLCSPDNGTMLAGQPPLPPVQPPGGARLDGKPATAPPPGVRDFSGSTVVQTFSQLEWHYDMELDDDGVIGTGTFSKVHVATHRATGQKVAVKAIGLDGMTPQALIRLRREIQLLRELKHSNIVELHQVFEEKGTLFMVMELCTGGELWHFLQSVELFPNGDKFYYSPQGCVPLKEERVAKLVRGVVEAVAFCHENKVAHRDLKLENVMLESPEEGALVKLIDFGFSKVFDCNDGMHAILGSPYYVAPEVLRARKPTGWEMGQGYGPKADMWSVGVISFMLLCGEAPFDGITDLDRLNAVRKGTFKFPPHAHLSPEAQAALQHPWLAQFAPPPPPRRTGFACVMVDSLL